MRLAQVEPEPEPEPEPDFFTIAVSIARIRRRIARSACDDGSVVSERTRVSARHRQGCVPEVGLGLGLDRTTPDQSSSQCRGTSLAPRRSPAPTLGRLSEEPRGDLPAARGITVPGHYESAAPVRGDGSRFLRARADVVDGDFRAVRAALGCEALCVNRG